MPEDQGLKSLQGFKLLRFHGPTARGWFCPRGRRTRGPAGERFSAVRDGSAICGWSRQAEVRSQTRKEERVRAMARYVYAQFAQRRITIGEVYRQRLGEIVTISTTAG
jgi:hypothetical protein